MSEATTDLGMFATRKVLLQPLPVPQETYGLRQVNDDEESYSSSSSCSDEDSYEEELRHTHHHRTEWDEGENHDAYSYETVTDDGYLSTILEGNESAYESLDEDDCEERFCCEKRRPQDAAKVSIVGSGDVPLSALLVNLRRKASVSPVHWEEEEDCDKDGGEQDRASAVEPMALLGKEIACPSKSDEQGEEGKGNVIERRASLRNCFAKSRRDSTGTVDTVATLSFRSLDGVGCSTYYIDPDGSLADRKRRLSMNLCRILLQDKLSFEEPAECFWKRRQLRFRLASMRMQLWFSKRNRKIQT